MDKPTQAELDVAAEVVHCYLIHLRAHEPGAHVTIRQLEGVSDSLQADVDELFEVHAHVGETRA